jgi:periplasmic protein CpxP/Spy
MSSYTRHLLGSVPLVRLASVAAALGATILSGALSAQHPAGPVQDVAKPQEAASGTVDQRIASLHVNLQITSGQEAAWANVARIMRTNDAAMRKLAAKRAAQDSSRITVVNAMKWDETIAKARARGLKRLIASFATLYGSMSDAQKHVADQVFKPSGRDADRVASK